MARQSGMYTITGTRDNLCFYEMEGKFYVRQKSSLTAKRVKTDAAFTQTMYHAGLLAIASRTASVVYKKMTATQKKGLYRKMTGAAMQLLKQGMMAEQAVAALECIYCAVKRRKKKVIIPKPMAAHFYLQQLMNDVFTERLPATCVRAVMSVHPPP